LLQCSYSFSYYAMQTKGLLPPLHIKQEAGWASHPVYTLRRRGELLSMHGIETWLLSCTAHTLVTTPRTISPPHKFFFQCGVYVLKRAAGKE
jgi:hypothetical protein